MSLNDASTADHWDCDLLVVGSGAGALSTAVTAAHLGLKVWVVEKDAHYGGTTAWSGGWMWIPRNHLGGPRKPTPNSTPDSSLTPTPGTS